MKLWLRFLRPSYNSLTGTQRPIRNAKPGLHRVRPSLEVLEDRTVLSTSTIQSNFNGTAIPGGDHIWFNSVINTHGLSTSSPTVIDFADQSVLFNANGTSYNLALPDAEITYAPSTTTATISFTGGNTNTWFTSVPVLGLAGNVFLSGFAYQVPAGGLPGGIHNVTWSGQFSTTTSSGVTVQWQWAAAVYTQFSSDFNALGVKPVDDNKASQYQNSDHAGTPENYKAYVIGGATGGGGSNFSGSYSGTAQVQPTVVLPATLSGTVFDVTTNTGMANVTVTLTGTNTLGQVVTFITTTSATGSYSFSGLRPGTYTLTETPPAHYSDEQNTAGSPGGTANVSADQISGIALNSGINAANYNFGNLFAGSGGGIGGS
jgi:hypothetical protein